MLPLNRHASEVCFCLNGEGEAGTGSQQGSVRTAPILFLHLCTSLPDQPNLVLQTEASEQVNLCKKCPQNLILLIRAAAEWHPEIGYLYFLPSSPFRKSFPQSKDVWELCKSFLETPQALHLSRRKTNVSYASESAGERPPCALSTLPESVYFLITISPQYEQGN